MKSTQLLAAAFFITILFTACSTSIYQLESSNDNYEYRQGRQILTQQDSTAVVFLNFEEQRGEFFILYVEAIDLDETPSLLDPADIQMEVLTTYSDEFKAGYRFYALDPERQIESLQKEQEDTETSHAVTQGLNGFFALVEVVSDAVEGDGDEAAYDAVKWRAVMHGEEVSHDIEINEIEGAKYHWQNEVLRKTTLSKDERFGGIVYLPFDKDAKSVKVTVPFGENLYDFYFRQIEIEK